jgi:uncharacterized protein (TIGR01244 family)
MKRLDERTFVSGQIAAEDVARAAAAGIRIIVNNRPDGEEPGQPASWEIEAAARAAELGYRWIPVAGGLAVEQIDEMAEALAEGPALIFCRSGTRSTYLWALARSRMGAASETIIGQAAEAGYDLTPIRRFL